MSLNSLVRNPWFWGTVALGLLILSRTSKTARMARSVLNLDPMGGPSRPISFANQQQNG